MVPMQKNNALSQNYAYACFTILFILIGLTTLASSMNLLVLRFATLIAEVQVQEKLEAAEARRQAVHLEGDVINPNGRLFIAQEQPEQLETISVCSCVCLDYKIWHLKRNKTGRNHIHSDNENNKTNISSDNKFVSFFRKKGPVKRLLGHKTSKNSLNPHNLNEIEMKSTSKNKKHEGISYNESFRNYKFDSTPSSSKFTRKIDSNFESLVKKNLKPSFNSFQKNNSI